jgi:hypothetical protein
MMAAAPRLQLGQRATGGELVAGAEQRAGFRVVEAPITFVDREAGSSKMSRAIVAEAVWKLPALRLAAARGRL